MGSAGPLNHRPERTQRTRHRARRGGGFLRGLSGVLAGGLVVLVVVLVVAWVVAAREGSPGPGAAMLAGHVVAAAVAVAVQVYADRTPGPRGTLAALGVVVLIGMVLTSAWLV